MASSRWIFWHVLCVILVATMIGLGIWQWMVAAMPAFPGGPPRWHWRNLIYAVQWWVFAGFGVWFWYRFMRDQRDADARAEQEELEAADLTEDEPVVTER